MKDLVKVIFYQRIVFKNRGWIFEDSHWKPSKCTKNIAVLLIFPGDKAMNFPAIGAMDVLTCSPQDDKFRYGKSYLVNRG
jgi:hypothetical protein